MAICGQFHKHFTCVNYGPFKLSCSRAISIEGFAKIARIGAVTIPDRQKTARTVS
jgi:hypothetical protein